jgi:hypothetical protein
MRRDDDAVRLEVGDPVVGAVALEDGFAEDSEMAPGFVREVAADGVVIVDHEGVGGLAFGAAYGLLKPAVEGCRRKWTGGISPGANSGDDKTHGRFSKVRAVDAGGAAVLGGVD